MTVTMMMTMMCSLQRVCPSPACLVINVMFHKVVTSLFVSDTQTEAQRRELQTFCDEKTQHQPKCRGGIYQRDADAAFSEVDVVILVTYSALSVTFYFYLTLLSLHLHEALAAHLPVSLVNVSVHSD